MRSPQGLIVGAVPPEKTGAASALSETAAELGGALGIAVLGSLGTFIYRSEMSGAIPAEVPVELARTARSTLVGAVDAATLLPSDTGRALLTLAREAFSYRIFCGCGAFRHRHAGGGHRHPYGSAQCSTGWRRSALMTMTITAFESSPDGGRGLARDTRVRWALEEVGQPYEVRLVSFKAMKEPAHLALHPFGQIPTYEEGDLALFETGAIVFHIAQCHAGLLPDVADAPRACNHMDVCSTQHGGAADP